MCPARGSRADGALWIVLVVVAAALGARAVVVARHALSVDPEIQLTAAASGAELTPVQRKLLGLSPLAAPRARAAAPTPAPVGRPGAAAPLKPAVQSPKSLFVREAAIGGDRDGEAPRRRLVCVRCAGWPRRPPPPRLALPWTCADRRSCRTHQCRTCRSRPRLRSCGTRVAGTPHPALLVPAWAPAPAVAAAAAGRGPPRGAGTACGASFRWKWRCLRRAGARPRRPASGGARRPAPTAAAP